MGMDATLKNHNQFYKGLRWGVGDKANINFWFDNGVQITT